MSGVSGLLNLIALLAFLVFVGGAVLAVVSASQGRSARGGVTLAIIGLVAGILFGIIGQGVVIVEPTQVAVVVNTPAATEDTSPHRSTATPRRRARQSRVAAAHPVMDRRTNTPAAYGPR